ncbi:ProQ/FinO family protein [Ancylobacter sonchi]|uniref:ProQ/FINO family protein n=1 Tax=Ancylobacter sonchi TaxID=1937790 RepID=UPI001BD29206|nr:ProQ/FinO family protein [Ancylobacter sonchi]MBS7532088.1 ProQ/FinO family protein [Ancylobacter sonchi]
MSETAPSPVVQDPAVLERRRRAQRKRDRKRAMVVRDILAERFPRCFMPKGEPKLPLKIGIYNDIKAAAPDIGGRRLFLALRDYTTGGTYLAAMREGADRIGLDGWPDGKVSAEQAADAQRRLRGKSRRISRDNVDDQDRAA